MLLILLLFLVLNAISWTVERQQRQDVEGKRSALIAEISSLKKEAARYNAPATFAKSAKCQRQINVKEKQLAILAEERGPAWHKILARVVFFLKVCSLFLLNLACRENRGSSWAFLRCAGLGCGGLDRLLPCEAANPCAPRDARTQWPHPRMAAWQGLFVVRSRRSDSVAHAVQQGHKFGTESFSTSQKSNNSTPFECSRAGEKGSMK